jgi:uncharacterized membrane protein HdeD (DUF308 family)
MNSTPEPAGQQRAKPALSEAAKNSLSTTHNLFRAFIIAVLGAFFVFQLDVSYLWLTGILTAASFVLGVLLLIRAVRLRESKLVLIGTISGLVVCLVMTVVILAASLFFDEFRDYQQCVREAITEQASSACRVQMENSLPRLP